MRVMLTAAAYVLFQELRLKAASTDCQRAQVSTLRERLLKLGAWMERSVRRIVIHLPDSAPWRSEWCRGWHGHWAPHRVDDVSSTSLMVTESSGRGRARPERALGSALPDQTVRACGFQANDSRFNARFTTRSDLIIDGTRPMNAFRSTFSRVDDWRGWP